jgi:hypothetical protein
VRVDFSIPVESFLDPPTIVRYYHNLLGTTLVHSANDLDSLSKAFPRRLTEAQQKQLQRKEVTQLHSTSNERHWRPNMVNNIYFMQATFFFFILIDKYVVKTHQKKK